MYDMKLNNNADTETEAESWDEAEHTTNAAEALDEAECDIQRSASRQAAEIREQLITVSPNRYILPKHQQCKYMRHNAWQWQQLSSTLETSH